jgi:hypothetical protein
VKGGRLSAEQVRERQGLEACGGGVNEDRFAGCRFVGDFYQEDDKRRERREGRFAVACGSGLDPIQRGGQDKQR